MSIYPERGPDPTPETIKRFLLQTVQVADGAAAEGNHPFGSVLVDETNEVIMTQGNINTLNHAEMTLCRKACEWDKVDKYTPEQLWKCTLYTNFEPCAMCTGACYWANIGRIVYGLPESTLKELTGDHPENPTMALASRTVLAAGVKDITVYGPFPEHHDAIIASHVKFWESR